MSISIVEWGHKRKTRCAAMTDDGVLYVEPKSMGVPGVMAFNLCSSNPIVLVGAEKFLYKAIDLLDLVTKKNAKVAIKNIGVIKAMFMKGGE